MGQGSSRELFVTMLKTMLKVRGVTVAKHKLEVFVVCRRSMSLVS